MASLEKTIQEGESLRKKIKIARKAVFLPQWITVLPGGNKKLQYVEEKIDLVDKTIQQLKEINL